MDSPCLAAGSLSGSDVAIAPSSLHPPPPAADDVTRRLHPTAAGAVLDDAASSVAEEEAASNIIGGGGSHPPQSTPSRPPYGGGEVRIPPSHPSAFQFKQMTMVRANQTCIRRSRLSVLFPTRPAGRRGANVVCEAVAELWMFWHAWQ